MTCSMTNEKGENEPSEPGYKISGRNPRGSLDSGLSGTCDHERPFRLYQGQRLL